MTDRTWVGGHDGNNVLSADIRVADLGSLSVSASFNPTSTRLDFVPASTS
jgi:hypothetical protein